MKDRKMKGQSLLKLSHFTVLKQQDINYVICKEDIVSNSKYVLDKKTGIL